jgi:two-component system, LytTR family, sensor kinase
VSNRTNWKTSFARELVFLLKGWALSFAGWGMVGFVLGAKLVLDTGGPWMMTVRPAIRDWLPWAVLTPLIFRFVRRFPIDRQVWKLTLPLHLVCCAVAVSLCQWWQGYSDPHFRPVPLPPPPPPPPALWMNEPGEHYGPPPRGPSHAWVDLFHLVTFGLPIYFMIVSGAHAALFFRRDQQRAASLARARLDALRSQLQPHFLFNTLNVIAELVHEDPEKADAMITALSDMLRLTLDSASEQLVPLEREAGFVERYFAIMQTRLGDRLQYDCRFPLSTQMALVPPFLLQPLVENAILHGIEPLPTGGVVTIRAWKGRICQ